MERVIRCVMMWFGVRVEGRDDGVLKKVSGVGDSLESDMELDVFDG